MARLSLYRTYRPTKDGKDPVIFKVKTLLQDEGLIHKLDIVSELSGVGERTMDEWFDGDTMKPINATVGAVISSLGYDIQFVKKKEIDINKELKAAADWLLKQNSPRAKPRKRANGVHT
jgi:hypothetical protein